MIPKNAEVTIHRNVVDSWGIGVEGVTETYKVYLNYRLDLRGNEVNTRNGTLESLPIGSIYFTGSVTLSQDDDISWIGHDGKRLKAKPDDINYIKNSSGKVVFTKVSF
jgi:hypothetical protein